MYLRRRESRVSYHTAGWATVTGVGTQPQYPMTIPASFLVVAHSARLLAQSAMRGGHPVRVLDLFDDSDTGRFAQANEAVNARAGEAPGFDREDLLRRAARLCPPAHCLGLVYGAGFEDDPVTLP